MAKSRKRKSVAVERTTVLEGYYPIYPGQAWFERRDPVGRSHVILHDMLPVNAGRCGRFTVTIKFEPLD